MKKITFGKNNRGKGGIFAPWGFGGVLWRTLVFLLLLFLLVLILSLFRSCNNTLDDELDNFDRPGETWDGSDEPYDREDIIGRQIPGADRYGLPLPEDNRVRPYDEGDLGYDPENPYSQIVENQLYVIFDTENPEEAITTFSQSFYSFYPQPANNIVYYNLETKTALLEVEADKRQEIVMTLNSKIPDLSFYIVPVEVLQQAMTPDDPVFQYPTLSWYFDPIQARDAWDITQGSDSITIGIVDSYFDLNHEDLKGSRIYKPYSVPKRSNDVAPPPGTPMDVAGHGTFVASVAAGTAGNGVGSAGIAPNCRIIPVSQGSDISTVTMLEGILYCIYNGADVINISCASYFPEEALRAPVDAQVEYSLHNCLEAKEMWDYVYKLANDRNVTIVWAAGNQDIYAPMDSSKRSSETIRVSAVDRDLRKADFSNFGNLERYNLNESTISAPGVDIFGATPGNTYESWPGTSFSAPIVAGAVALMKSIDPNLTTAEIIEILQSTGKPLQGSPTIGKLIQIKDALREVKRRMR